MKVHREVKRQWAWMPGLGAICSRNVVVALGDWFKWRQNAWANVTCKRCVRLRPGKAARGKSNA